MVADKVVEAFRDINMEGDIRGSSDRYLRQVTSNPEPRLRRGLRLLLECQRQLRNSGEDPQLDGFDTGSRAGWLVAEPAAVPLP